MTSSSRPLREFSVVQREEAGPNEANECSGGGSANMLPLVPPRPHAGCGLLRPIGGVGVSDEIRIRGPGDSKACEEDRRAHAGKYEATVVWHLPPREKGCSGPADRRSLRGWGCKCG